MDWKWEYQIAKNLIQKNNHVLEIGCGKGSFIKNLTEEKISFNYEYSNETEIISSSTQLTDTSNLNLIYLTISLFLVYLITKNRKKRDY